MTTRTEKRRAVRANLVQLLGGHCVHCGESESLHFDHVKPFTKSFNIATSLDRSIEVLLNEVEKCQLLCVSCHRKKTGLEQRVTTLVHGLRSTYTNKSCRCDSCKHANSSYYAKLRARKI